MKYKYRLRKIFTNPLTIVLPIVLVFIFGWHQYTYAGLALSMPDGGNILPNGTFTRLVEGVPVDWHVYKSGDIAFTMQRGGGYAGGNTLGLTVTHYGNGDASLATPKVAVRANQTYLFKGYYKSTARFALLARLFYIDGSNRLQFVRTYPGSVSNTGTWSTVSDAFDTAHNIVAVQFVYRVVSTGSLQVNDVYMEPKRDIYVTPTLPQSPNLIPNSTLAVDDTVNMPGGWSTYQAGSNTASFSYDSDTDGPYVQVSIKDYKNGEAKWQYLPLPVSAYQYYRLSLTYKSDTSAPLIAEYEDGNGHRQFYTIATLMPASEWTTIGYDVEIPSGMENAFFAAVLQHSGTLATRGYSLVNLTKSGPPRWNRPLTSITFDDGRQSAYANALPILSRDGYKATFYINPSSIETPGFMSAAELETLHALGAEIGAHGYAHDDMTAIDSDELNFQLQQGRDYLRKAGFTVTDFASPYGNSDAEVQWFAQKYFKTLRSTESGVNTRQNFQPYSLRVLYIDSDTSSTELEAALQAVASSNGWLILVYHQIGNADAHTSSLKVENTTVTTGAFLQQMAMIKKSQITVLPVSAAYSEVHHQ